MSLKMSNSISSQTWRSYVSTLLQKCAIASFYLTTGLALVYTSLNRIVEALLAFVVAPTGERAQSLSNVCSLK